MSFASTITGSDLKPGFPQVCVVLRIYRRPNPRYHFPFLYDDEDGTIRRYSGFPGREGTISSPEADADNGFGGVF